MSNDLERLSRAEPPKGDGKGSKVAGPLTSTRPSPRYGLRIALALIIAGLICLGSWIRFHRQGVAEGAVVGAPGARPSPGSLPVPVVPGVVVRQDVPIYLDGLGTVQAFNTVTVRSRVDGQVQRVAFVEGEDVRAGDLLAQIDPAPFQAQLDQNSAKKSEDEAQLSVARLTLQRDADLLAGRILSQQDYDTQKALVDQLAATVQGDQAAIENARVQLNYTTITSPLAGRTGIRQVDQGNIVHANDSNGLVVITQLKPISVVFTLPEQNLNQIQQHLKSAESLVTLAVERDDRTPLGEGKLAVIDNQIDTTTGTIRLKAIFPNEDLRLWPGQFVNVRLRLEIRQGCSVVPASVVQRGPEGTFAFVISNEFAMVRPIKVAPQIEAGMALIDEGLQPGERVVVDGQYRLQPGARIKLPAPTEADSAPERKAKPELPARSKT